MKKTPKKPAKKSTSVKPKAPSGLFARYAVHHPDVAWRILDGEAAIVTPADGTLHLLNQVGTAVWEGTQMPVRPEELVDGLQGVRGEARGGRKDVADFVRELEEKKMLLLADETGSPGRRGLTPAPRSR